MRTKKTTGSDLLVFSERITEFLKKKSISVVSEERNNELLIGIEETEIYKKLINRPFNKDGVLHDAVAMRYVKELRMETARSFSEINSFFVTDTAGFLENKLNYTTRLPYVIRAEELLNILWLSNPILDNSILVSNVSKILTIHLEKKLPDKEMLHKIDEKLGNYSDYGLDEKACADLAINIAELDTRQLTELINTEEKEQFKERLLEAVRDARSKAEKSEKTKIAEYNSLLEILEQEKIEESRNANQKFNQSVSDLKDLYDNYTKLKEKDLIDNLIGRDNEELGRLDDDIEELKDQAKGRTRIVFSVFLIILLFSIVGFIMLFALPNWQDAEVYTYILSLAPLFFGILFYLFTGRSLNFKKSLDNIHKFLNKRIMGKIEKKMVERKRIEARLSENTKKLSDLIL